MKQFTIKDFILYNAPCFSCQSKIIFQIFSQNVNLCSPTHIIPLIHHNIIELDLKLTYTNSLKLKIDHKTNKIQTSNSSDLTKYLTDHRLFLSSYCSKCLTTIESNYLDFNLPKQFIAPVGISKELLIVKDNHKTYWLTSHFLENKSELLASTKTSAITPLNLIKIDLPLLPLYKLNNKNKFINKVRTYLTFS